MWFEALFSLKINLEKSEPFLEGRVSNVEVVAELRCKVGYLPTTYLRMPLGDHCDSMTIWDELEECFRKRLVSWKTKYISKGWRTMLIKSTLPSLAIYLMCILPLPRKSS